MAAARPLKDVFAELTGDDAARPDAVLAASGHGDLPPDLVAEAVVNYADTAPVEVAEHLAPFVTANSGVPAIDQAEGADDWSALLATAPTVEGGLDPDVDAPGTAAGDASAGDAPADDLDVDFGGGAADPGADAPDVDAGSIDEAPERVDATVEEPAAQEPDGNVYDTAAAPIDLSDVDDFDGDEVDPAELDG
jgi:hypothetical protein